MICCYNARRNDPYKEAHHPRYTPLTKVDDRMIREVGIKRFGDDASDVAWLDPESDSNRQVAGPGSKVNRMIAAGSPRFPWSSGRKQCTNPRR